MRDAHIDDIPYIYMFKNKHPLNIILILIFMADTSGISNIDSNV